MGLRHILSNGRQRPAGPPGGVVDVLVASKDGKQPAGMECIPWETRVLVDSRAGWSQAANALLDHAAESGRDAIFIDDDVTILPETFAGFDRYYPLADVFGFRLRGQPGNADQIGWTLQRPNPNAERACYLAHVTASLMYVRNAVLVAGVRFPIWPGMHFQDIQFTYDCWLRDFAVAYVPSPALHDIAMTPAGMVGSTLRQGEHLQERRALNHACLDSWAREHNLRDAAEEGRIPFGVWGFDA